MTARLEDSAGYRWLHKKVLDRRALDDMERTDRWSVFTTSTTGVVDARVPAGAAKVYQGVAQMTLTGERWRDGAHSIRLRTPTRLNEPAPASGRGWGDSGLIRHFDGEDWSAFNRISFWVYPDCPGFYTVSLDLELHNDGTAKVPPPFGQEGLHTLVLRNHEWNQVVWEIGNVARDRVTSLNIAYGIRGSEPEAADSVSFDFDQLDLERVEEDYIEGWNVWPGRISYSHAGYPSGATKRAIASGLAAGDFELRNETTGRTVLRKRIETVATHLGRFQVMDFSEVRVPGSYTLVTGALSTRPFRIGPEAWRDSILKALNFFYAERCGAVIPGVHGVCHRDWQSVHGDRRIIMNGGWHDAGDLTQGLGNTGEAAYGMLSLAERLRERGDDPELLERLMEEGRWGLDWVLKTSFGDGYRASGSVSSRKTDGVLGTFDDVVAQARNQPRDNFLAAAVEAVGYRVLKERDPILAAYCLKMAEADWRFGLAGLADAKPTPSQWTGTFDSANVAIETASVGVIASLDLYRDTGDQRYAGQAVVLARTILDSQQRERPDWDVPLTGFFYTSPARDRLLHYCHRGREEGPILALAQLAEALPEHPDWMKWYSAVALHAEYLKETARYTEPYGVLPASIYKDDEYATVPETRRESFRKQVLTGVPLGRGHYLRLFPAWMDYRGHFGSILPKAQALGRAAQLRGDPEAAQLAREQMEWIIGRNPFAQSAMWGEGFDFATLYTPCSGDMVGGLPVGIQTRGESDVPYWPVQSTWTYKEIWVHPPARWIWLAREIGGPPLVQGEAAAAVEFADARSGERIEVKPDASGHYRALMPEGKYTVRSNGERTTGVFLPGGSYQLDLRPGKSLDFDVSQTTAGSAVTIRVTARGSGSHRFTLRADNLAFEDGTKTIALQSGAPETLEWRGRVVSPKAPWIAVVIADGDPALRKEVMVADKR